jgi:hypothetical protein
MMREIHIQIRALGEDLQADCIFKKNSPSHRRAYSTGNRPDWDQLGS